MAPDANFLLSTTRINWFLKKKNSNKIQGIYLVEMKKKREEWKGATRTDSRKLIHDLWSWSRCGPIALIIAMFHADKSKRFFDKVKKFKNKLKINKKLLNIDTIEPCLWGFSYNPLKLNLWFQSIAHHTVIVKICE